MVGKRLFIGVLVREPLKAQLVNIQKKWASELALEPRFYIPQENFHMTLQFLGEVQESIVPKFLELLGAKTYGPSCSVSLNRPLAFPHFQNAKVLVLAGPSGLSPANSLVTQITQETEKLGFKKEERLFIPHITLFRTQALKIRQDLQVEEELSLEVNSFALYESTHTSQGSVYQILKEWELR